MMSKLTESDVEHAALQWFGQLGYALSHGPDIGPDIGSDGPGGPDGCERVSYDQVVLVGRLRRALARLNPHLTADVLNRVLGKLQRADTPALVQETADFTAIWPKAWRLRSRARWRGQRGCRQGDRFRRHRRQRLAGRQPI